MKQVISSFLVVAALVAITGCSATQYRAADRGTVETAQREVSIGLGSANVAAILGSPDMVSSNESEEKTWVYDSISTDLSYLSSNGAIVGLVFGNYIGGANYIGTIAASQQVLTVTIKFDEDDRVRDFSYYTSAADPQDSMLVTAAHNTMSQID
jgi:outer membrane protein assembly factor BamE (lipoprotein component of BamABCDE complex)